MKLLATLLFAVGLALTVPPIIKGIMFNQNCGGHLELAANSNTIPAALSELNIALEYLEENHLNTGYTSIFWRTPDEDIHFWFTNLKSARNELAAVPDDASPLEKSNMLIKLRETLLAHGKDGEYVTMPDGISRYPSNGLWAILITVGIISILISIGIFFMELHDL